MKEPTQQYDDNGSPICGARTTGADSHERCHMVAGYGTDHVGFGKCKRHMGCTTGVSTGAFRLMARSMGDPVHLHPADAISATIAATAGHVAWLEAKVGGFKFSKQVKLDDEGVDEIEGMTTNQLIWFRIYGEERDRLIKYCEVALRSGLAQRQIELAEQQGRLLAMAIDQILGGLRLTDEQLQLIPDIVPAALRGMVIEAPAIEGEAP